MTEKEFSDRLKDIEDRFPGANRRVKSQYRDQVTPTHKLLNY